MSLPLHQRRAEAELTALKIRMGRIAGAVRAAIEKAADGVIHRDEERLYEVMLGDHPINRDVRDLDAAAHAFVALHLPAATSLRTVSSILRLNIALERVGDYAVTIGRVGVQLEREPQEWIREAIQELSLETTRMLDLAVRAFVADDTELATRTMHLAEPIDTLHEAFFNRLTAGDNPLPTAEQVRWITVAGRLERVSDQAFNVCEETLFATTGRIKRLNPYRILFTDPGDGFTSRIALALAERRFHGRAEFAAASWSPEPAASARLAEVTDLEVDRSPPLALPNFDEDRYHVVIALAPGVSALGRLPFHTVRQTWEIGAADVEDVVRELDSRIGDLLQLLCGDEVT
ncbi:MAG: hypothetical protein KC912_18745 [Proteobacteria bacterium]|nr:hypothetical protein [Pseudomonadota bacterium]